MVELELEKDEILNYLGKLTVDSKYVYSIDKLRSIETVKNKVLDF